MRAAYEEAGILMRRKDISKVIADPGTAAAEREKLQAVLEAREFALSLGLTPKDSFTKYSKVDSDVLVWVLLGAKPDSFDLYTWWFPIVGHVPYKGFFEKKDAEKAALKLEQKGYETWVRGSEAMSTLGWFNDPLLSTTLRHEELHVVNTVIHEILHSTVWLKNHVDFNESLANFVGHEGAVDFYQRKLAGCDAANAACADNGNKKVAAAEADRLREYELADAVAALYGELDALYKSSASRGAKLKGREEIFNKVVSPLRAKYPQMKILNRINNAEIIQLKLYLTSLRDFAVFHAKLGRDWQRFISALSAIADKVAAEDRDPFELLRE